MLSVPVFPIISFHGLSARMLICSGAIRGASDHSLTVESREQEAMVKGRLGWHVKPEGRRNGLNCSRHWKYILFTWASANAHSIALLKKVLLA